MERCELHSLRGKGRENKQVNDFWCVNSHAGFTLLLLWFLRAEARWVSRGFAEALLIPISLLACVGYNLQCPRGLRTPGSGLAVSPSPSGNLLCQMRSAVNVPRQITSCPQN